MNKPPVSVEQIIETEITGVSSEGQGVGRFEGFTVFVPFALPGESVSARIIRIEKNYAAGTLEKILSVSEHRIKPPCPLYYECGGCNLQHCDYQGQLNLKKSIVNSALTRIGRQSVEVLPVMGCEAQWRMRNKGAFQAGICEGMTEIGFFSEKSHELVPVYDCLLQPEKTNEVINHIRNMIEETTALKEAVVRISSFGQIAVNIITIGALKNGEAFAKSLHEKVPDIASVTNTVLSAKNAFLEMRLIYGAGQIRHSICGLNFDVSAESFLQVNTAQTEKLYETALNLLAPQKGEEIADIYCGIGTVSLLIARHAGRVTGIEYVRQAVLDAKHNCKLNGIRNAEFFAGQAETLLPALTKKHNFDSIVVDPPRKGCDGAVIHAIINSGAKKLVYISCNPTTLARDISALSNGGFELKTVQPVDMFPHTSHVECVCLMTRRNMSN